MCQRRWGVNVTQTVEEAQGKAPVASKRMAVGGGVYAAILVRGGVTVPQRQQHRGAYGGICGFGGVQARGQSVRLKGSSVEGIFVHRISSN